MYQQFKTIRVLRYDTNINTGEKFPVEVISDYRTVYTGMTKGSEIYRIKNELKM